MVFLRQRSGGGGGGWDVSDAMVKSDGRYEVDLTAVVVADAGGGGSRLLDGKAASGRSSARLLKRRAAAIFAGKLQDLFLLLARERESEREGILLVSVRRREGKF